MSEKQGTSWEYSCDINDADQMHKLGKKLGKQFQAGDLILLTGELGAGKTTLSRGIGEGMGVRGPVTSPTFVLARTHPSLVSGPPLVHVDAYRLQDETEFDDLDLDFMGSVVLVEWGAGLVETGDEWLEIIIERPSGADFEIDDIEVESEPRSLHFAGHGNRWAQGIRI